MPTNASFTKQNGCRKNNKEGRQGHGVSLSGLGPKHLKGLIKNLFMNYFSNISIERLRNAASKTFNRDMFFRGLRGTVSKIWQDWEE